MAFRFILGRAGSGKTHHCLESIAAALREAPLGDPLILLVPEQATFQMDRRLVSLPGIRGTFRAQVLSFHRLAWRVFAEVGGGARPHIDEVGKVMALRALLSRRRGEFRVFDSATGRSGFLDRLARTISELRAYGIDAEHLEAGYRQLAALGRGDTILAGKLHDLALVSRDLTQYLATRWVDPDDYLSLLAARLGQRPAVVSGARIWVDGFMSFTPQELAVLRGLLEVAAEVNLTLCLDPHDLGAPRDGGSTFHPTLRTYDTISRLVGDLGIGREETVRLTSGARYAGAPALGHLEREYTSTRPRPFAGATGPVITLVEAESRRAEVAAAAREMVRLARERGYRWRDMGVLVRSLELYASLLQGTLTEFGIPFFIDHRQPLAYHPLVELVRSAVEVAASEWAYEPVFRVLKTDLFPMPRELVDRLENYVLEHGIRGGVWTREAPWAWWRVFALEGDRGPADEERDEELRLIDGLRREVADLLAPFVKEMREGGAGHPDLTVAERARSLWSLLSLLDVPGELERWRQAALAGGRPEAAQEHERALDGLINLLDQMVTNLGDERVSLAEFGRILEAGLESLRPGRVPPRLDQVVIGSVDRSRQPDLRVSFVLGANNGVFPAIGDEDVVFDDREREELRSAFNMELSPSGRERAFNEDYLAYVALTRSSERLWVSYARSGGDGGALAPSSLVFRLKAALPPVAADGPAMAAGLALRRASLLAAPHEVGSEPEALGEVTRFLSEMRRAASTGPGAPAPVAAPAAVTGEDPAVYGAWLEMYNWLVAEPERRRRADAALRAVGGVNQAVALGSELTRDLLRPSGGQGAAAVSISYSSSRLEDYVRCPFSYFARAALRLRERPRRQVKAPQIGSYYHGVLGRLTRELIADRRALADLAPEELGRRLQAAVEFVRPRLESDVLASTAYYRHLAERLTRTVRRTLEVLAEHERRGAFRPVRVEEDFETPLLAEPGGVGAQLTGIIDRLELAEAGGQRYARIIDLKSTARPFNLARFYLGLDLQLPVYLLGIERALDEAEGATPPLPVGAFALPVSDPFVRARRPLGQEELERERLKLVRLQGLILDEPEVLRLMDASFDEPEAGPLLPGSFTSRGGRRRGPDSVSRKQLDLLSGYARQKVEATARDILRGAIEIAPVSLGPNDLGCQWCDYRPVCGFDQVAGDKPRRVRRRPADEIWSLMEDEVGERRDP